MNQIHVTPFVQAATCLHNMCLDLNDSPNDLPDVDPELQTAAPMSPQRQAAWDRYVQERRRPMERSGAVNGLRKRDELAERLVDSLRQRQMLTLRLQQIAERHVR
jgi:hypothetical protein